MHARNRLLLRLCASAAGLIAATSCEKSPPAPAPVAAPVVSAKLAVGAASSLKELCESTAATFEASHAGTKLQFSFDASSTISRQIEAGGTFQCILSADAADVDRLAAKVDAASRVKFLSNRLVIVARPDLPTKIASADSLKDLPGRLALGGEAVPVGKYARAFLAKKGLLDALQPKIVNADNVRAALTLVESGAADAAIVYATDARVATKAKLAFAVPADDDPGPEYVAAAVAGSSAAAHDYVKWLHSSAFQEAAGKLGFVRVEQ
jgi:molybdate transport system substrate-binding protein